MDIAPCPRSRNLVLGDDHLFTATGSWIHDCTYDVRDGICFSWTTCVILGAGTKTHVRLARSHGWTDSQCIHCVCRATARAVSLVWAMGPSCTSEGRPAFSCSAACDLSKRIPYGRLSTLLPVALLLYKPATCLFGLLVFRDICAQHVVHCPTVANSFVHGSQDV